MYAFTKIGDIRVNFHFFPLNTSNSEFIYAGTLDFFGWFKAVLKDGKQVQYCSNAIGTLHISIGAKQLKEFVCSADRH